MAIHQNDLYDLDPKKFFQIPKFFEEEPFNELSLTARYIYGLLLDQFKLSEKETFTDSAGYIVAKFPVTELMKKTGLSNKPVIKAKKDLEDFGFIKQKRVFNGSNYIYVMKPSEIVESVQSTPPKVENVHHESVQSTPPKVENVHSNYTKQTRLNKTRLNNQDSSTAIGGENNRQTTLIETDLSQSVGRPIGWSGIQSYLESQNLALSPKQIGEVEDFMEIDGLEKSLIEKAIDITAGEAGSKRSYKYLKGILTNWKNGNIRTVADHEANEADRGTTKKTGNSTQTYRAKSWWTEAAEKGEL